MKSIAALAVLGVATAQPAGDLVTSLPGWADPFRSNHYSGYLSGPDGKQMHYYFVESETAPAESPVVIWLNGGPGCSSLIGWGVENGPFTMNGDGTLTENAGRWNIGANVLFLESPVGVGFSYWPGQPGPYQVNDTTTANDNLAALLAFYAKFPAFATNPLWISGESYAGVYVPMFAQAILAAPSSNVNLKGILVGNGAAATGDWYEGGLVQQRMQHAYQHGLFSPTLKSYIDGNCTNWVNRSDACNNLLNVMSDQMGPLNAYDIEVTCALNSVSADGTVASSSEKVSASIKKSRSLYTGNFNWMTDRFDEGADPCSANTDALTNWLNDPNVQSALHVNPGANALGSWAECASGSNLSYTRIPQDETKTVYPGLLNSIAVLIFNGDQDECIPYIQDQAWTAGMGFGVKADWRPWIEDNQVAGYVTEYSAPVRFTFATVKRAGHEVPMYQPLRALAMMQRFIAGQDL